MLNLCNKSAIRSRGKEGFSLLEALIAFFILVMGVSFIYSLFPLGMRVTKQTQTLSSVSFLAQKKIEELKTAQGPITNSSGQDGILNWTVTVTDYTPQADVVLKKVQLDVDWLEGVNQRKKIFITYFK
jgi:Tfp pilus assembly protein PilV